MKIKFGKLTLALFAVALVSTFYFLSMNTVPRPTDSQLATLAKCLDEQGAKFYGTFWCSHCNNQKAAFGEAAEFLPYVECSETDGRTQTAICRAQQIQGYPTWVFPDGSRVSGQQDLDFLAAQTGCAPVTAE